MTITRAGFLMATMATALIMGGCGKAQEPMPRPVSPDVPVATVAADNVSDADVTEHVKTALHLVDSLKGFDITVVTTKGDVRLTGVLDTQAQIDDVLKIAREADGAHTLHNELTLKK